jgi:hypothetical protein
VLGTLPERKKGPLSESSRKVPVQRPNASVQPWQSWGDAVRYLFIMLAILVASVLVTLITYRLRH